MDEELKERIYWLEYTIKETILEGLEVLRDDFGLAEYEVDLDVDFNLVMQNGGRVMPTCNVDIKLLD